MVVKEILKSRTAQILGAFVLGGVLTGLFLQESVLKKSNTSTSSTTSSASGSSNTTRIQIVNVKRSRHKITYPDGRIVESEVYESNSEQVERIKAEYEEKLKAQSSHIQTLELHKNPKHINVYAGYALNNTNNKHLFSGGFNYSIWGPMTVGINFNTSGTIAPTVGFTF